MLIRNVLRLRLADAGSATPRLLGGTKPISTVKCLGIEVADALEMAEQTEVNHALHSQGRGQALANRSKQRLQTLYRTDDHCGRESVGPVPTLATDTFDLGK